MTKLPLGSIDRRQRLLEDRISAIQNSREFSHPVVESVKKSFRRILKLGFVVALAAFSTFLRPQDLVAQKASLGQEFWLAFPGNTATGATQMFLYVVSTGPAEIDVDFAPVGLTPAFHQHVSMAAANQVVQVTLPDSPSAMTADIQSNDTVETKGIHVSSSAGSSPFSVYGFTNANQTADAYLGLPVTTLGVQYYVASYNALSTATDSGSQFVVVGTVAGTLVTVTPTADIGTHLASAGAYSFTLGVGQTYLGRAAVGAPDLTGTLIQATQPVAVFSGNRCGTVPTNFGACDTLVEQLPPTDAWGEKFLTVPFALRKNGDTFRFIASTDNTTVTINGGTPITLNHGQFFETVLTSASEIHSNSGHPLLVMQYEDGVLFDLSQTGSVNADPAMMTVYPYEQFLSDYTITSPSNAGFDSLNFVNLIAPASIVGSVTVDGVAVPTTSWTPIGTTAFDSAQIQLAGLPTNHHISGPQPFGVLVYGTAPVNAYAYPGGMAVAAIATVKQISVLDVSGQTLYVGQQACVSAQALTDPNAPPQVGVDGVRVDFTTNFSSNNATGSETTDATGTTTQFCYTGTLAGVETVTGTVGSVTGTNTVTWLPRPVIATVTANNKVYDGTSASTIASCTLTDLAPGSSTTFANVACSDASNSGTFTTSTTPFPPDDNVANGKRVLSNTISLTGSAASNFTFTSDGTLTGTPVATSIATTTANITPIPLNVTITAANKPYDGTNTATITGCTLSATPGGPAIVAGDTPTCTASGGTFSDQNVGNGKTVTAATVTIQGNPNGNYSASVVSTTTANITPQTLTVTPNAATRLYGAANPTFTYAITGFVHSETVAVVSGTPTLSTTAVTSSPIGVYPIQAAGTLTATNYVFAYATGPLTITAAPLTVAADAKTKVYGTSDPTLTYQVSGLVAPDTAGGVLAGSLTRAAGESVTGGPYAILQGSVALLPSSNYTLSFTGSNLTITPAPLTVNADAKTKVFGSADPTLTYQVVGLKLTDTASGVLSGLLTRTVGESVAGSTYPIAKGTLALTSSNYTLTFNGNALTITPAPLTVTADAKTKIYGAIDPALTYQVAGLQFSDTALTAVTGSVVRATGESVTGGPYAISQGTVASASSNYTLSFTGNNFTITPAPLTVVADAKTKAYGTSDPALTYHVTGLQNGDLAANVLAGTLTRAAGESVLGGPYAISQGSVALSSSNYTIGFTGSTLTITPAVLTITAPTTSMVYGAAVPSLVATVGGFVNGDTPGSATTGLPSVTTTATASSSVGPYPTTASAGNFVAPNYTFQFVAGTLTITPAALSVTANNKTRSFGVANPTLDGVLTGVTAGDNITASYSTTATISSPSGPYPITATLNDPGNKLGNYTVTNTPGTLTITAMPVTATVTAANKPYDGTTSATGTCALSIVDPNLTCSFTTETFDTKTVGNVKTVTATGITLGGSEAAQYTLTNATATTTANITPLVLTVKANDASKMYGAPNPGFSAGITGFLAGETITVVTGTPGFSTPATASTGVGTYAITSSIGSLAATNYTFVFANGTLTITPALLTVTADNQSKLFGAPLPALTATITGFVNGDGLAAVSGSPALTTTATQTSALGTYPIVAGPGNLAAVNYTFAYVNGLLTVGSMPVTVSITAASKIYDGTNSAIATCATSIADPNLTCAFAPATFSDEKVGTGKIVTATGIVLGGTAASQYTLSNTTATTTATIIPAPLTIAAEHQTKVYDGQVFNPLTSTYSGWVPADDPHDVHTETVLIGNLTVSGPATTATSVGHGYLIVPGGFGPGRAVATLAGSEGEFTSPSGVAVDGAGNLYVADAGKNQVLVIDATSHAVSVLAGNGTAGSVDDAAANAEFKAPTGIAVDATGNIYVADTGNNSVRMIAASTHAVTTIATGFNAPRGVAVDAAGNVYVADTGNSIIVKLAAGTFTASTLAGNGQLGDVDDAAANAEFNSPTGVAVDAAGNVYVADSNNNAIRLIAAGTHGVSTVANGFSTPIGVAVDAAGTIYVADTSHNLISLLPSGTHTPVTIAGDGNPTGGDVDGAPFNAEFNLPQGIAVDSHGVVYIADLNNTAIRTLTDPADGNYTIAYVNNTLDITPALLTVTADNKTRRFMDPNPVFTSTTAGFVNSETLATSGVTGSPAITTTADINSPNGTYPISAAAGTLAATNYSFTFVNGTLTITADQPPVALDDSGTTHGFGQPVTVAVLANDSDPDGDALTVTQIVSSPGQGTVVINAGSTITYTPAVGVHTAPDTFVYQISDGHGGTANATVTINFTNTPPVANPDVASTHGTPVLLSVLANDTDADGDTLTLVSHTSPGQGTLVDNHDGTLTYTPNANFIGGIDDTFTYVINDGHGGTATGTVTIHLPNQPPVAGPDTGTTHGTPITVNVLANDSDPDGDTITGPVSKVGPFHGSIVINPDHTVTYTPATPFAAGTDTWTYTISDNHGGSTDGVLTITLTNTPPVAVDDAAVTHGAPVTIPVLANDSDADHDTLTITSGNGGASNGSVMVNSNGTITYTPAPGFNGPTDSFPYTISDGHGGTATAHVTITFQNNAPVAVNDTGTTHGAPVTISVLANDSDADNDTLTITSGNGGAGHGSVTVNPNGTITYTPNAVFFNAAGGSGTDSFPYTISDGHGGTATATVTITVTNAPPVAVNDSATVPHNGTSIIIPVLVNDTDADGDTLTVTSTNGGSAHGTLAINPDGTVTYTPAANNFTPASFTYTINDGHGASSTATVTITFANQPPVANPYTTTTHGAPVNVSIATLLAQDSDPDGDTLAFSGAGLSPSPSHGTLNVTGTTITYTPTGGFFGPSDSFGYTINDGHGGTAHSTVTINYVNTPPVAVNDTYTTFLNTPVTITPLANDTDADGDTLTITTPPVASHGTIVPNPDGVSGVYTPNTGFRGTETMTYTINDGHGASASATITITSVNRPPVAHDDTATTNVGTPVAIAVLGNDTDADGDTLTVTSATTPANGTTTVNANGTITYTPNAHFHGTDTFSYSISDGNGGTATANVTVTINPLPVTVAITALNKVYDGTTSAVTTCATSVTDLNLTCTFATTSFGDKNVGTGKTVTATGITIGGPDGGDYALGNTTATTTANITPAPATVTAGSGTKVFGTADPTLTATSTGFFAVDNIVVSETARDAGESVGNYTTHATATGATLTNYTVTVVTGTLAITPATPIAIPTGGPFPYDGAPHAGACAVTGVGGVSLTGTLSYTPGGSTTPTNVGTYTVHCDYTGDPNYTPVYTTTTIVISPRAATVTAGSGTKMFGTADPTLTATSTGFETVDNIVVSETARDAGESVGTYTTHATATGAALTNYAVTVVTGTFAITPATPIAIPTGGPFSYDGTPHAGACAVTGVGGISLTGALSYTPGGSTAPTNVGTYTVHCDYTGDPNYTPVYTTTTIVISPRAATVTAGSGTKMFGTADPTLTATSTGFETVDNIVVSETARDAGESVGNYTTHATATGAALTNYAVTVVTGTLAITPATPIAIPTGGPFPYDGTPHAGTCTVTGVGGVSLTGMLSYTPGPGAPTNVGTYTVHCDYTGDPNYTPVYTTTTIVISPRAATVTAGSGTKMFGTADPTLTATSTGFESVDSIVVSETARDAGEAVGNYITHATATGAALSNYTVTVDTGVLAITPATPIAIPTGGPFPYDGAPHAGACAVTGVGGISLTGALSYTPGGSTAPTNVGTYTVNCDYTGDPNYTPVHTTTTIVISPRAATVTAGSNTKVFGTADPTLTATSTGFEAADDIVVSETARDAGESVGSYTTHAAATGAALSNYTVTVVTGALVVTPATLTVTASSAAVTFGDAAPSVTPSYAGFVGTDTSASLTTAPTCTTTYTATTPVGSSPVATTCSGAVDANYTITYKPGAVTIAPKTVTISVPPVTTPYSGTPVPTNCSVSNGLAGTLSYMGNGYGPSATAPTAAGVYTATCTVPNDPNYTVPPASGTVTITAVALTITASSASVTYGAVAPTVTPSYAGFVPGDSSTSLETAPTCATTYTATTPVGSSPTTTCSGAVDPNYTITYKPGAVTIADAPLTATVTASDKVYNGTTGAAGTCVLTPLVAGLSCTFTTETFGDPNVGTGKTVTATGITLVGTNASDYTLGNTTATTTASITPAPLTVTASSASVTYGDATPTVTPSYTGFVGGESKASLTTAPTCTTGYSATTPVANSPVATTCSGAVDANYAITYVPGAVTVNRKALTVVANSKDKQQGAANPVLDGTLTGVIASDGITATYSTTATVLSAAGTYPITPALVDPNGRLANYVVTSTNGTLTVLGQPAACSISYPFSSSVPRTSVVFNESEVLRGFAAGTDGTIRVWYSDEHAMSLGVRQVSVKTSSGTTVTNYDLAPLSTNPGSAVYPAVGSTAVTGDQAAIDPYGRPIYPSLFITDITANATSTSGDWQYGGTAIAPHAVFGTWKGASMLVDETSSTPSMTVTVDADPSQNSWSLGTGSDAPPSGLTNEGYGTEVRWNLNNLLVNGQPLQEGHTYRLQFMVHDGDQNKAGGDVGQACMNVVATGMSPTPALKIAKSVDKATAAPGDALTYTINYSNVGATGATNVVVTDVLPAQASFVSATGGGTNVAGTVTWPVGALAAGASGSVTLQVQLDATFPSGTTNVTNTATMVSAELPTSTASSSVTTAVSAATGSAGVFVIGDLDAIVGNHVTFWGAQWEKATSLSGGPSPAAFKGFANTTSTAPPSVGGTWTTAPGNSAPPPSSIPAYLTVIVSSLITQSGPTIAGNIPCLAVVKTDPGYAPDPGHAGTGTIVSLTCVPVATNNSYTTVENTVLTVSPTTGVLTGDSDSDGGALTAAIVSRPSHGTVTLNANGSFTYTPASNFIGTDTFTYQAIDGVLTSNVATVTITVTQPPCTGPVAAKNDSYSTYKNTTLTIAAPGVLTNDTDPQHDPLTATIVATTKHGVLTLNANGSFVYVPTTGFAGTDTFTYQVSDGSKSDTATVTITVTDRAPVAANNSYTTVENTALTVAAGTGVLTGDSDADGDSLTAAIVAKPSHGTVTLNANGSFTYTPANNFTGADTFTYQANDGTLASNTATVTITVTQPPCTGPVAAKNDSYSTYKNTTLTIAAPGVLTNDTDPQHDPLTASLVSTTKHGTLTLNANGSFVYVPTAGFTGTDTFTYQVSDGSKSDTATVTITVTDRAPVAANNSYTTVENTALTVSATTGVLTGDSDADGDSLTAAIVAKPSHGTVTLNANGSFTYTPANNFTGTDAFTYQANDGTLASNTATVTITVTQPPCTGPVAAKNDSYSTYKNTTLTIAAPGVLTNDTDPQHDPLTASLVSTTKHGTLTLNANGSFVFVPTAGFAGTDTFTYQVSDGSKSDTATVTITVTDRAPVAANNSYTTVENTALTIAAGAGVLTGDSDPDGDALTAVLVSGPGSVPPPPGPGPAPAPPAGGGPAHGTVKLNTDGSFTYTPANNFTGTDTFTYQASDGTLTSNTATVTITVTAPACDGPSANNDSYSAAKNTTLTVAVPSGVLANDTDPQHHTLTASVVASTKHGVLTLSANGSFTYVPTTGFTGADTFTYQVSDGSKTDTATVTITVK